MSNFDPKTFVKPTRPVSRVFLHCSASSSPEHNDVSVMKEWHLARGFSDVGYHYFIKTDGTIQIGRSIEQDPAAQEGNNKGTIAICCHGLTKKDFTDAQMKSVQDLCEAIDKALNDKVTFHGHCEVSNKACPVYDYKRVLNLSPEGYYGDTDPEVSPHYPVVDLGDDGDAVFLLQKILGLKPDGRFGPETEKAVKAFQKEVGLKPDGVVGPKTWAELL